MALKYTRVKDKDTGHEYDVLAHKFDDTKHEHVDRDHWPDSPYPRAPKPNVKGIRPRDADAQDAADASEAQTPNAANSETATEPPKRSRAPKTNADQDAAGA